MSLSGKHLEWQQTLRGSLHSMQAWAVSMILTCFWVHQAAQHAPLPRLTAALSSTSGRFSRRH